MADDLRKLLDHIVRTYVVRDDLVAIDLDAAASQPAEAISSDKRRAIQREADRADDLAAAFSRGLALAHRDAGAGGTGLVLDDRDPEQNAIADALIGFLVSHELAGSRAEEIAPCHYRYHVAVEWDRLRAVARTAGIDLDAALRHADS